MFFGVKIAIVSCVVFLFHPWHEHPSMSQLCLSYDFCFEGISAIQGCCTNEIYDHLSAFGYIKKNPNYLLLHLLAIDVEKP